MMRKGVLSLILPLMLYTTGCQAFDNPLYITPTATKLPIVSPSVTTIPLIIPTQTPVPILTPKSDSDFIKVDFGNINHIEWPREVLIYVILQDREPNEVITFNPSNKEQKPGELPKLAMYVDNLQVPTELEIFDGAQAPNGRDAVYRTIEYRNNQNIVTLWIFQDGQSVSIDNDYTKSECYYHRYHWTPDSKTVILSPLIEPGCSHSPVRIDVDTKIITPVFPFEQYHDFYPFDFTLSPSGKTLLYEAHEHTYLYHLGDGSIEEIPFDGLEIAWIEWRDGEDFVVGVGAPTATNWEVVNFHIPTRQTTTLFTATDLPIAVPVRLVNMGTTSPSGKWLAFMVYDPVDSIRQLWVYQLAP